MQSKMAATPNSFMHFIRQVNPRYHFYPHVQRLLRVLDRVLDGSINRLMVFMPPRHFKSETISRLFSAYYLLRYPYRWVGLSSYGADLAYSLSRNARTNYVAAGGELRQAKAMRQWESYGGGGMWAAGVGGAATGKGFDLGIIDDPLKNAEEAASETIRAKQKDWYRSVFTTRQAPDAAIIIIQCMTGDTPVLMADGTERPLREIKVGDRVATYDNGKLATSTVQNHKSNRLDSIFRIKTTCGKIVHANERHPFLVEEHGQLKWVRLKNLTTASRIVTVQGNGVNGREKPASLTAVRSPLKREDTAPHTTTKSGGQTDIARRRLMQRHAAARILNIGTESPPLSTMQCWQSKMVNALSANSLQETTYAHIGAANCALTIATKRTPSEDFCVTTVISPLAMPNPKQSPSQWSNTSDFTTAQIESIDPAGVEEVFDIQIERTENFIANGLVSHNTRWHEDDLAGWLLAQEHDEPEGWHIMCMEALKPDQPQAFPPTCTVEPDPRSAGEALCPPRYPVERLEQLRGQVGSYFWSALYDQRPRPPEGAMIERSWLPIVRAATAAAWRCRYWDKAASTTAAAKYSAGVLLAITPAGAVIVEDVVRGQWGTHDRRQVMLQTAQLDQARYGGNVVIYIEQEPGSSGLDSVNDEIRLLRGFAVYADRPSGDKDARACAPLRPRPKPTMSSWRKADGMRPILRKWRPCRQVSFATRRTPPLAHLTGSWRSSTPSRKAWLSTKSKYGSVRIRRAR